MNSGNPAKSHKVSARDVAQAAGVSQSTVSRVLSGRQMDLISEATRERVLQIARKMGYSPNPIAQALRGSRSNLLGLIVREIADPFFAKFIAELSIQARSQGYHIVLGHAGSDPMEALELNSYLDMRHTDGVFLLGDLRGNEDLLFDLMGRNRVVALCRGPSPASLHTINVDNQQGIQMLMDHLLTLGHTKIGFMDGGWLGDIRERLDAYRDYLQRHGMELRDEWVETDVNTAEGGYRAAKRFLALADRPTALLASDDEMAIGAIRAATDAGFGIPEDLSVTGFDNIDLGRFIRPGLTTIGQPVETMCREALSMMVRMIEDPDSMNESSLTRVKPELVIRESTGRAPGSGGE